SSYESVKKAIEANNIPIEYSELTMRPKNTIELSGEVAEKTMALLEALEDLDDVQEVYSNFEMVD
ncbi:MAG: YebC/PmpR family DNA-binding transcriptional regulator, partial [Deferribacterales bacterium]